MHSVAIQASHITKLYKLYQKPVDRLKESLSITGKVLHKDMYALNDVDFEIHRGESVGIIGTNGSGKSTLLKIITGVLNPTEGNAVVNGKLSALLELGAGFNPEYTGIENIYLSGMIMGYSREEMDEKLQSIVDFADIGEFIHQPVKTYSSGMFVRLAFATQIYADPDVLIVDEALSVGDMRFQQKCYRAMEQIMQDKTVVLVSHDSGAILHFCKRVIWIEKGKLMFDGDVAEGIRRYQSFLINGLEIEQMATDEGRTKMSPVSQKLRLIPVSGEVQRAGTGEVDITECGLFDEAGEFVETAEPGSTYRFAIKVRYPKAIPSVIVGIAVKNRLGEDAFGFNSDMIGLSVDSTCEEAEYIFSFVMPQLNAGQYTISTAVASGKHQDHIQLCWLHDVWLFSVGRRNFEMPGMLYTEEFKIFVNKEEN